VTLRLEFNNIIDATDSIETQWEQHMELSRSLKIHKKIHINQRKKNYTPLSLLKN
jgi:hypothetical protein